MSDLIPSQNEEPLCRCKALYLGTSIFNSKKFNESNLNLSQLQDSISERYPIDGSNFAKGIQTWLTIYPSGIQMEHSSNKDLSSISALFYYPIKSLVYCGALRFIINFDRSDRAWKFVPLDTEIAQKSENSKNPPLFVVFLKGIEPSTKKQIIECHVFVVGMVKTSMKLIESCQKAFNLARDTVPDFYKKFGNVPVVYCMKNDLSDKNDKRVLVKSYDSNGYFYATENTPIDVWQLFEENEKFYESVSRGKSTVYSKCCNVEQQDQPIYADLAPRRENKLSKSQSIAIDPYEKSENLIKVEKRIDPVTGQNIYVRYLTEATNNNSTATNISTNTSITNTPYNSTKIVNSTKPVKSETKKIIKNYDCRDKLLLENDLDLDFESELNDEIESHNNNSNSKHNHQQAKVVVRQEKTPSPIIVEKYIKTKAPQVIIKEIHVHEPAPPPVKIVQTMDNQLQQQQQQPQLPQAPNPNRLPYSDPMTVQIADPYSLNNATRPNVLSTSKYLPQVSTPGSYPVTQIRMNNPNTITNCSMPNVIPPTQPGYTGIKSLLNQTYGCPLPSTQVQYTDPYARDNYSNYSVFKRNLPQVYQKYNNNEGIYDYAKPRFDYSQSLRPRNSIGEFDMKKYATHSRYGNYDYSLTANRNYYDKYPHTKHTNMYSEHSQAYKAVPDGGVSYRPDLEYRNSIIHNYKRDMSSGRVEMRPSYKNY